MAAIGIGFFALYLAVTLWVYFDAIENDRSAIAWALATFFLAWFFGLPLILYAINKDKERPPTAPGAAQRQALYVISLTGLTTFAIGAALTLGATISNVVTDTSGYNDNDFKDALASGIVSAIVGAVVWFVGWTQAQKRLTTVHGEEFRAFFKIHRAYLYTVLALFWAAAGLNALWFLGGMVSDALGSTVADAEQWVPALGPLVVTLGIAGYHRVSGTASPTYLRAAAVFEQQSAAVAEAQPEPPAPEPAPAPSKRAKASGPRFCSECGAGVRATDSFCPSCGAAVR